MQLRCSTGAQITDLPSAYIRTDFDVLASSFTAKSSACGSAACGMSSCTSFPTAFFLCCTCFLLPLDVATMAPCGQCALRLQRRLHTHTCLPELPSILEKLPKREAGESCEAATCSAYQHNSMQGQLRVVEDKLAASSITAVISGASEEYVHGSKSVRVRMASRRDDTRPQNTIMPLQPHSMQAEVSQHRSNSN